MSEVRTDLWCHSCSGVFVALIDFSLDGNHRIECPHCGHAHYRIVKNGIATDDRHNSDLETHVVPRRQVWRSVEQPIVTSSASHFLRDLWLNRGDL